MNLIIHVCGETSMKEKRITFMPDNGSVFHAKIFLKKYLIRFEKDIRSFIDRVKSCVQNMR